MAPSCQCGGRLPGHSGARRLPEGLLGALCHQSRVIAAPLSPVGSSPAQGTTEAALPVAQP